MPTATLTLWDDADCGRLHDATLTLLADVGVEVLQDEGSLRLLRGARRRRAGYTGAVRAGAGRAGARDGAARVGGQSRAAGTPRRCFCGTAPVYLGTGSDCLYVCDPDTHERRRAVLADIEGMAALAEKLPHMDFAMTMASPEDVDPAVDDVAARGGAAQGHAQAAAAHADQRTAAGAHPEMAAVCRGDGQHRRLRDAVAASAARR